ncbi:MAG: 60S ribosomal protein L4 [Marteilia pararefringens]
MVSAPVVPVIDIQTGEKSPGSSLALPKCYATQIRPDLISRVHDLIMKNTRQPNAVAKRAGKENSAQSWHTGRAVSRVTRIKGSGTNCAGNGARANFCRGGHMAHPLDLTKRFGRLINHKERRLAIQSAIASSQHAAFVRARGHIIDKVSNLPLVISGQAESVTRTAEAVALLQRLGCYDDVMKCWNSKRQRAGKGKMRDRRYKMKRGPLVVFKTDNGITRAFRNIPGVSLMCVDSPNLLKLAPGGKAGRLIIFTENAFRDLDSSLSINEAPNVSQVCQSNFSDMKYTVKSFIRSNEYLRKLNTPSVCKLSYHSKRQINPLKSKNAKAQNLGMFYKKLKHTYADVFSSISR